MRLDVILIDNFEKHIHYLWLDIWSQSHEFAVNAVQYGLEVVSLTWVLTVEKLKETAYKIVRNMLHDHILSKMDGKYEFQ